MEALAPVILGLAFLGILGYVSCKKRAQITRRCPKCGTICNASPWSTGLMHRDGSYVHDFKCNHCGNKFTD